MPDKIDPDDWLPRLTEVTAPGPDLRSWTCLPWEDVTDKAFGGELMAQSARAALRLLPVGWLQSFRYFPRSIDDRVNIYACPDPAWTTAPTTHVARFQCWMVKFF